MNKLSVRVLLPPLLLALGAFSSCGLPQKLSVSTPRPQPASCATAQGLGPVTPPPTPSVNIGPPPGSEAPDIRWAGTPNNSTTGSRVMTVASGTEPLATIYLLNTTSTDEAASYDLLIVSAPLPLSLFNRMSNGEPIDMSAVPNMVWELSTAHGAACPLIIAPALTGTTLAVDWPYVKNSSAVAPAGMYYAYLPLTISSGGSPSITTYNTELAVTG